MGQPSVWRHGICIRRMYKHSFPPEHILAGQGSKVQEKDCMRMMPYICLASSCFALEVDRLVVTGQSSFFECYAGSARVLSVHEPAYPLTMSGEREKSAQCPLRTLGTRSQG